MRRLTYFIFFLLLVPKASYAFLVEEPKGCLTAKHEACSLRAVDIPYQIKAGTYSLNLSAGSAVSFRQNQIIPLQGNFWIESSSEIELVTPYVKVKFKGNLWVESQPGKTTIRNLNTEIMDLQTARKSVEILPSGFENWYSGLDSSQQVVTGVMQPLPYKETIRSWVKTFRVPKDKSIELVSKWKPLWKKNVEISSDFYAQVAKEKLLSQQAKDDLEFEQKAKRAYEQEQLRKLYRMRHSLTDQGL